MRTSLVILVILVALAHVTGTATAQGSSQIPIVDHGQIDNIFWDSDSKKLGFSGWVITSDDKTEDGLFSKELYTTHSFVKVGLRYDTLSELSSEEKNYFNLNRRDNGDGPSREAPQSLSPNKRYIVFLGNQLLEDGEYPVLLGDRKTQEIKRLTFSSVYMPNVLWSSDSRTFVFTIFKGRDVSAAQSLGGYVHIAQRVVDSSVTPLQSRQDLTLGTYNGVEYQIYREANFPGYQGAGGIGRYVLFALSGDGKYVLLPVTNAQTGISALFVLNTSNPKVGQILDIDADTVYSATFAPESTTQLYLATKKGLISYNLISRESITLELFDSKHLGFDQALFSPDGRWLAVVAVNGSERPLYLYSMFRELAQSCGISIETVNTLSGQFESGKFSEVKSALQKITPASCRAELVRIALVP